MQDKELYEQLLGVKTPWRVNRIALAVDAQRIIVVPIKRICMHVFPGRDAVSEGINAKIQRIKKMAYGFRNKENFKTAIYFHCGGLNLYPC